jgi:lipopolysaccharide transport system ATP-binding protein
MAIAVRAENLGKRYRIGLALNRPTTLGESLQGLARRPLVHLRHLTRPPADDELIWAVRDVSFELGEGTVLGIIGRNGAGKSTLLRILSRITEPTEGYADVFGRVGSLLEVGTGFHEELSGRDNIFLNGAILGMRRREINSRYEEIVEFSGVEKFIDTPLKRYSTGMKMRLAFAVAAHLDTDILLVDEVLAVGDAEFQKRCLGKMHEVTHEQGRTVVFVSHSLASVKDLCDRVLLLERGRCTADGDPESVIARYLAAGLKAEHDGVVPAGVDRLGTGEARVVRVLLLSADGAPASSVRLGEPFTVALELETREPIPNAVLEVGISTLDGRRVCTSFSTDRDGPLLSLAPGRFAAELELNVTLLPGHYTLDAGIHRGTDYTSDLVERVFDFEALAYAAEGSDAHRMRSMRGFVRPDGCWRVPERSESLATGRP